MSEIKKGGGTSFRLRNPFWSPSTEGEAAASGGGSARPHVADLASTPQKRGGLRLHEDLSLAGRVGLSLVPVVVFLAWWVWATNGETAGMRHVPPTILPSPMEVVRSVGTLWTEGALVRNVIVSLLRVLSGFGIAVLLALPLGLMMGSFTRVNATFSLVGTILSYLPLPALIPLSMAWWGIGERQKIGFLALVAFAYLLPLVVRHVSSIDHKFILSAQSQGANSWQIVGRVLLPMAMPDIYSAMRLCLGVGWTYIILVEIIKTGEGLGGVGNLIMVYHRLGHMPEVYLTVLSILLVGFLIDRYVKWFGHQLFPWRPRTEGEG